jgi:hypothetical protein
MEAYYQISLHKTGISPYTKRNPTPHNIMPPFSREQTLSVRTAPKDFTQKSQVSKLNDGPARFSRQII